jgi:riboflavin kinase
MDIKALLKIVERGGLRKSIQLSSSQLGKDLGISQQTASRRLKALEEDGLIKRQVVSRGQTVRITSEGRELLGGIYLDLSSVFGKEPAAYTICGIIKTGIGEGEYYMKMDEYNKQFTEKLGFNPFPGTLNLELRGEEDIRARQSLSEMPGITIDGFKKDGRTFGSVKCFRADIEDLEGAVIIPSRTHHSADTIEVIAKEKIRNKLGLNKGNRVCVRVRLG